MGVGRRVAGAGGRAVAEELPGAGTRALPGRACSPQRGVAQVSGRRGHGDAGTRGRGAVGGRALRSQPFPRGHLLPCPAPSNRGPALPRKPPPFCGTDASAELLVRLGFKLPGHVKSSPWLPAVSALVIAGPFGLDSVTVFCKNVTLFKVKNPLGVAITVI